MDVTHIALLSPISESRLHKTVKALWLRPLCHAKCYPPPPQCMSLSDGHELQRQSPTGAMRQVFSQLAGVGQGAHVLSTVVLSKLCGRSNMHRAQKTLKGKAVCGVGKRRGKKRLREAAFLSTQSHFYSFQSYPQQSRVKNHLTKPPGPWLTTLKAGEHRLHGWQCLYTGVGK